MQFDMTRAWKDEEYRESLSQEQQAQVLEGPVGEVELSEAELEQINGTGGIGGGGGYAGNEVGISKGYGFAGGIVGNSYYCGNFSIRPTTNLNLGEKTGNASHGGILQSITSELESRVSTSTSTRVNRFDFSCSVSGGLGGGPCIFAGR